MKMTQQESIKLRLNNLEQALTSTQCQVEQVAESVTELKLLLETFSTTLNTKLDQLEQLLTRRN
jgi:chromosome segregation ATPase